MWCFVPGFLSLCLFAYLLTLIEAEHAGRTYAAYGGVYILFALMWLWIAEGVKPGRWDTLGAAVCFGRVCHALGSAPGLVSARAARWRRCEFI